LGFVGLFDLVEPCDENGEKGLTGACLVRAVDGDGMDKVSADAKDPRDMLVLLRLFGDGIVSSDIASVTVETDDRLDRYALLGIAMLLRLRELVLRAGPFARCQMASNSSPAMCSARYCRRSLIGVPSIFPSEPAAA
jgi:hypothetical protein